MCEWTGMASLKIQETNDTIKTFDLNNEDPIQYRNQKLEIMSYLNSSDPIIESYEDFTLEACPGAGGVNVVSFWCGYLSCNDKSKIKDIYEYMWGDWIMAVTEDKIGFDCGHINDIRFSSGIDELDQFTNQQLEEYTFKGPQWVIQQLKDVVNSYNN